MAAVSGDVTMTAESSMVIAGMVRPTAPPLVDQIAALAGQDPALMGASGYGDDVFTTRLWGDTS